MRFVREEFGHEEFDGYGHSLGGETVVNVARHKPEHVRAVILDGSCGLDEHSLLEMIGRTGQFAKAELLPALGKLARNDGLRTGWQALHYIGRHPARTLAEGLNAGATNLHPRIEEIIARGIFVSAIQSPGDIYFPFDDVERDSRHLFGDHFHKRDDPESNHLAPQLDPVGTAEIILHALKRQLHPEALEPALDMAA
jgi:pimeloyl-ACP methyl ester carboxylesterase